MELAVFDRDIKPLANCIQRRWRPGPVRARQRYRINEALFWQSLSAQPLELRIEKAPVELCIVSDDGIVAQEFHQPLNHVGAGEYRLVAQEIVSETGDPDRSFAKRAFGVYVDLKLATGLDVVVEFYTSDFDDALSVAWLEPGGFGVERDFPHASSVSPAPSSCDRNALRISSTWMPA